MKGIVFKVISGFYDVYLKNKIYRVKGSGNLRANNQNPLVGDVVEFLPNKFITKIYHRKNKLIRPKVSNIDQVVIIVSLKYPKYSSYLLNKFLAIVEFQNIKPIIIFTKIDLTNKRYSNDYINDGYKVFEINNLKKIQNFKSFINILKNKITVFIGQTGVGKSSFIKNLTGFNRKIQEISIKLGRGKHTTRVVEILLWNNCFLIDTPGFSSFNINLSSQNLSSSFKNFKDNKIFCKFKNCLHDKEKECKIKEMINAKKISLQKYKDYLKLLKEIKHG